MAHLRSLQSKIFLVVAGLVVAVGGCAYGLQAHLYRQYELTMTEALNAPLATVIAGELAANDDRTGALAARAKPTFAHLMSINPNIEIYLLSRSGDVLAFTAPPEEVELTRVDLAPIRSFIANDFVYPILGDNPKDPNARKVFSAARLDPADENAGFVYVVLGGAEFDAVAKRIQAGLLPRSALILSIGGLFAGLIATLYMRADVVTKLRRLLAAIGEFRGGGFRNLRPTIAAGAEEGDEIDTVSHAFDEIAAQIEMLLRKLDDVDRSRRELIANVSHDLRAPIASAKAHLETLVIKQDSLDLAQRRDHLEIAWRQIERLARLAEELFELGKLEAPNARMTTERFPVAELVQDVVQKFQIEARARGVELFGHLGTDMPHVRADIALIERVLDNLIENAIRHTPRNGRVDVAMAEREGSVAITIGDTGEGIAPEDLPHIFERFYRAQRREGRDGDGSGLGLAIVRRIMEMHGGAVTVESERGVGTRFCIVLPADRQA